MRVLSFPLFIFIFIFILIAPACVDQDFDSPPGGGIDPGLTPTMTIAELKALHTLGEYEQITTDEVIRAIVISSDEEGNFFKQLVIQDETGGIELRVDVTDLFTEYPPGRQVYLNPKGLWLGDYNGLIQLGAAVTGQGNDRDLIRIPETVFENYIIKGSYGNSVEPTVMTIDEINLSHTSTLIQINDIQFLNVHLGETYANPPNEFATNLELEECSGDRIILRTSDYSTFASTTVPDGKGSIIGVYGVFGSDKQIIIRDLDDVNLTGERCTTGGGNEITIRSVRDAFAGGQSTAPDGTIKGIVISDRTTMSTDVRNMYVQDASGGILVRFSDPHSYNLGDEVVIDVTGQSLELFNGLLQINGVSLSNSSSLGQKPLPAPRVATVNEILLNAAEWESTRVQVDNVTLSGQATFNGSVTVTDASGAMIMFTRSQATFSGTPLPTGEVDMLAIVSYHTSPQLIINNSTDVTGGGGSGSEITIESVRDAFTGSATTAPTGYIRGIVISDISQMNTVNRNVYLQNGDFGIALRFAAAHSFNPGDEIQVTVTGQELSEFNGLLQVNNIPNTNATLIGNGTLPAPRVATISQILANAEAWESTRVRVENVQLSGAATYNGSVNVTDATGSIIMFTRAQATFSGTALPSGQVDLVAIVSEFNDPQLIINTLADVE